MVNFRLKNRALTLAYLEPSHIHDLRHIHNPGILKKSTVFTLRLKQIVMSSENTSRCLFFWLDAPRPLYMFGRILNTAMYL